MTITYEPITLLTIRCSTSWCRLPAGHDFAARDEQLGDGARMHSTTLATWESGEHLVEVQLEAAAETVDGIETVETPGINLYVGETDGDDLTAEQARILGLPGRGVDGCGQPARADHGGTGMSAVSMLPMPMPATADDIVCPLWCKVPKQEHLDELASLNKRPHSQEREVPHYSAPGDGATVVALAFWDGSDPEPPSIRIPDGYLTADEAEELIEEMRAAVAVMRT